MGDDWAKAAEDQETKDRDLVDKVVEKEKSEETGQEELLKTASGGCVSLLMAQYAATMSVSTALCNMEQNTEILEKVNIKRLKMTEATVIYLEKPTINIQ
ncbi:hypothetical protein E2C01_009443 [Portunus trituberculatus]|uniref:Uncharacterized protein n=1 Tax=Portunus trituberculatus TaxID=210409 RepID=A0A5B7D5T3_PORTR|nr:hypothetical protein [Portunus trituberculatus]